MPSILATKTLDSSTSSARSSITGEKQCLILCLLLAVATLAVYNPITHNNFISLDDDQYITQNSHVRSGLNWETVKWAFTTYDAANWHPLTWLSHTLDYQLFKLNPAGHHYMAVLLHTLNAILLFLLLQRATGFTWRSVIVAALFALHPLNVESVAWAAERKNLLSMFFFLLAMQAYGTYIRRLKLRSYLWVFILYALGLMAKPQIITFPFILLLWDYWPLGRINFGPKLTGTLAEPIPPRSWSWLIGEKIPLLALSLISAFITMRAQHAGGAVRTVAEVPFSLRLENAVISYLRYLGHAVWPLRLSPMYPHPEAFPVWQVVATFLFLALATVFLFRMRRRYLIVGWLFFLGSIFPMIGIVQVGYQAMADRYAYLPFIGLFIMAVWSVSDAAQNWEVAQRWLVTPAVVIILLIFGVISRRQIEYWHDNETLWNYALQVTHNNFMAEDQLARDLARQGHMQEAIKHFRIAENLHFYDPPQLLLLGIYEFEHGHPYDAIDQYERVLHNSTDPAVRVAALDDLGLAYIQLRNYDLAKTNLDAALQLNPGKLETHLNMGLVAQKTGDLSEAVRQYSRAVEIHPSDVGYLLLQRALEQSGRLAESQVAYQQAVKLSSNLTEAHQNVNQLLTP
ncbi:MAG TPA: tetratricopeptide repeat protein [Terriglobales bacterium]|nr:tetratricopeptide repeat protein [Terriglobales bacterium]